MSYQIQTFSTTIENEIKRLRAQVDLFWDQEIEVYKQAGIRGSLTVLECGCGPGFLIEKLANEFPNSRFTGLEIDSKLVEIFNSRIRENQIQNISVVHSLITDTAFSDSRFDYVISRLVLEHLSDPLAAIREVARVLKPGGKAVFIDNDFDFHLRTYPNIPELSDLYDAYCRARIAEGGNPKIGRELPSLLKRGGFGNIGFKILGVHSELTGDDLFLQSEGIGISLKLVQDGYLSSDKLGRIATQWRNALREKPHTFFRQLFVAVGEKQICYQAAEAPLVEPESLHTKIQTISAAEMPSPPSDQLPWMERYLCQLIAAAIDIEEDEVRTHMSPVDLGLDSLAAVDVQSQLGEDLGISIELIVFFEKKNITAIAEHIIEVMYTRVDLKDSRIVNSDFAQKAVKYSYETPWEEGEI